MYNKSTLETLANKLGFSFNGIGSPKEIILNFSDEKNPHGCKRGCKYCNWKNHPLAQHYLYPDKEVLDAYLSDYKNGIVTLCGGGDPLYQYQLNKNKVHSLIDYLQNNKYLVRIITREQENYFKLRETYPYVLGSFSIDTFEELNNEEPQIEYSIVLNRKIYTEIIRSRGKCLKGFKVLLREPIGTDDNFSKIEMMQLKYLRGVEVVTLAINKNKYLVGNDILYGYEIFR